MPSPHQHHLLLESTRNSLNKASQSKSTSMQPVTTHRSPRQVATGPRPEQRPKISNPSDHSFTPFPKPSRSCFHSDHLSSKTVPCCTIHQHCPHTPCSPLLNSRAQPSHGITIQKAWTHFQVTDRAKSSLPTP
ncbi:hypothetical protein M758_4G178500 [Ceratodon purpureus]|nr:hypothetical protein M758_4G178500 [Ceratodon purpureus]